MEREEFDKLLMLLILSFLFHLAFINSQPFFTDEGLYLEMIAEQKANLTLVPTYLGYEAGWKPPLFFWTYSLLTAFTSAISDDVEFVYRFPTLIFAMANIALLYAILRKSLGKDESYWATALYAFSADFVYTNERLLLDTFAMTLMFCAIYAYTTKELGNRRFLIGAAMTFFAFLTKSLVSFVIPIVVAAYLLQNERKTLLNPLFIISFAGIPLAIGIHYFSIDEATRNSIFFIDMAGKVYGENSIWEKMLGGTYDALVFLNILLVAAVVGFRYFWKENYAMSLWMLLGVFPLIAGALRAWYFYVVLPPIVFFAIRFMQRDPVSRKLKTDEFFRSLAMVTIAMNVLIVYIWAYFYSSDLNDLVVMGKFLAGKENVAIIGRYAPASTITAYKFAEELERFGKITDFGWVLIPPQKNNEALIADFAENYRTEKYTVNEEDYARLFWTDEIFRKKSDVEQFEYVVVSGLIQPELECFEKIQNASLAALYKRTCG